MNEENDNTAGHYTNNSNNAFTYAKEPLCYEAPYPGAATELNLINV